MGVRENASYGPMFVMALVTSWTLVTGLIGMLAWPDQHSPERVATWIGLWVFAVAVPTVQAVRIHGVLREAFRDGRTLSPRSRGALAQARVLILICGSMVVLLVFGLMATR